MMNIQLKATQREARRLSQRVYLVVCELEAQTGSCLHVKQHASVQWRIKVTFRGLPEFL